MRQPLVPAGTPTMAVADTRDPGPDAALVVNGFDGDPVAELHAAKPTATVTSSKARRMLMVRTTLRLAFMLLRLVEYQRSW